MSSADRVGAAAQQALKFTHAGVIDGKRVEGLGEPIEVEDPATGETVAALRGASAGQIDDAVAAARRAFNGEWSKVTAPERAHLLWRFADLVEQHVATFVELEVIDNGMPKMLAEYSVRGFFVEFLRYYSGWCTKITGDTIPASPQGVRAGESLTYTRKEPIGVVGAIIPWNSPMPMAALKIAPALAAGCTLVLKPAEQTPLSALLLADLAKEAGIPDGVLNVLVGHGAEAGHALAAHPDVDKIAFTGSTEVGKAIVRTAADSLKKVSLELGGKSPVVVFPDADLSKAIPAAVQAAFFLQGQNCMAGTRLFAHQDIIEPLTQGLSEIVSGMKLGHGLDEDTMLGPLISSDQRERVMGYIESGKSTSADLLCGGNSPDGPGYFVEPTIFSGTTMDMKIAREEIFGPVLCVQAFGDEDLNAVAQEANATVYGLSGSVWTRDITVAHRMAMLIDSGQVSINCHAAVDPAIPFGGNKQSGWGREFGREGLEPYLKTKATTVMLT